VYAERVGSVKVVNQRYTMEMPLRFGSLNPEATSNKSKLRNLWERMVSEREMQMEEGSMLEHEPSTIMSREELGSSYEENRNLT
jgi:hypothetical protein